MGKDVLEWERMRCVEMGKDVLTKNRKHTVINLGSLHLSPLRCFFAKNYLSHMDIMLFTGKYLFIKMTHPLARENSFMGVFKASGSDDVDWDCWWDFFCFLLQVVEHFFIQYCCCFLSVFFLLKFKLFPLSSFFFYFLQASYLLRLYHRLHNHFFPLIISSCHQLFFVFELILSQLNDLIQCGCSFSHSFYLFIFVLNEILSNFSQTLLISCTFAHCFLDYHLGNLTFSLKVSLLGWSSLSGGTGRFWRHFGVWGVYVCNTPAYASHGCSILLVQKRILSILSGQICISFSLSLLNPSRLFSTSISGISEGHIQSLYAFNLLRSSLDVGLKCFSCYHIFRLQQSCYGQVRRLEINPQLGNPWQVPEGVTGS
ncbi:hypothetical protein VP01_752g2 [Puccinia sorghi]|uniref:Uncharacterized protein n=1 Tax=Puccinia sorghi TaxID=27349 RepID=A0A0L6UD08_9BASI|nr:hypothetical protein VP01_752g2 [Puccinia sorghi]